MPRFMCLRIAAMLIISAGFLGAHASAQEAVPVTLRDAASAIWVPPSPPPAVTAAVAPRQRRPGALIPLYVSFGALQVLDAHSTSRALDGGAVEANPIMRGIAGNRIGLLGLKAAATTGFIFATEKMWKRNKTASIIFMIASNSAMAWVVQNNYRAVR